MTHYTLIKISTHLFFDQLITTSSSTPPHPQSISRSLWSLLSHKRDVSISLSPGASLEKRKRSHTISQNVWWSGPSLSFLSLSHRELGSRWCRDHHALIEARLNSWMDLAFMTWGTCGGGTEISYGTELMEYRITSAPFYNRTRTRNGPCFIQVFPPKA